MDCLPRRECISSIDESIDVYAFIVHRRSVNAARRAYRCDSERAGNEKGKGEKKKCRR